MSDKEYTKILINLMIQGEWDNINVEYEHAIIGIKSGAIPIHGAYIELLEASICEWITDLYRDKTLKRHINYLVTAAEDGNNGQYPHYEPAFSFSFEVKNEHKRA